MTSFRRVLPAILALAVFVSAAQAQYSIGGFKITGAAPYTNDEIIAATGLATGQLLAQNSLVDAAHHLLDTGLFDDAQVSTAGQGKARTVVLELKPYPFDKLLPASFANFVWYTPEELIAGIHARVPLFHGYFADAGNFPDIVQAALEQMMADKNFKVAISHTIVEPTTQHPVRVVNFVIDVPRIFISSATITGAPPQLDDVTANAATHAANFQYNEGLSGVTVDDTLLRPARDAGYITAKFDKFLRTPIPLPRGIGVNFTAHMVAGPQYKVSTITWTPVPFYTQADFTRDAALHPGEIASDHDLQLTARKITTAYHSQGYMDFYLLATPTLDDTAHTVAYNLRPFPGEQYHLHQVTALNLSPEAQASFDAAWKMKPNDIYDESYVGQFLYNAGRLAHLGGYTSSFQAAADSNTHLVDLTITFIPPRR